MNRYRQLEQEIRDYVPGTLGAPECLNLLDKLYALRHDFVDEMIKHDWSDNKDAETQIATVLIQAGIPDDVITWMEKKVIPNHPTGKTLRQFFRMTPDNYKIEGHKIMFKEVTVTSDVEKGIREKNKKYLDGMNQLQVELDKAFSQAKIKYKYTIEFAVVSVKTDGSNISTQWPSARNRGVVQHMRLVQAYIQYTREHLIRSTEKGALEAMFNLKFNIGEPAMDAFRIPEFDGMQECGADFDELLHYARKWMETAHDFAFTEVTGEAVSKSFCSSEEEQKTMYPESKKPRNFLLIQVAMQSEYSPSTILSDQIDMKAVSYELLKEEPITPVQHLARDMLYQFQQLDGNDMDNYYRNRQLFDGTSRVPEPGTFKLGMSKLSPESKTCISQLDHISQPTYSIESLPIYRQETVAMCSSVILKILSDLQMTIGMDIHKRPDRTDRTIVDKILKKFSENELDKHLIRSIEKTVAWHVGHLVRDITESLIAHSGMKRSKYWSLHAYHNGNVLLCILPSKSLEVSMSYIRFFTVFKEGYGFYDHDNIDSTTTIDGVNWVYSKIISLDLNRLLAINISFEKALLATAVWFQYYAEDQSHFPLQASVRSVFSFHLLIAVSQKMKICALFDNLRYLIPSCTSSYSGFVPLIDKFVKRPFKTSLEVFIYSLSRRLLVSLAQSNKLRFFSKIRLLGLTVDQSTIGASGVYPSLLSDVVYRHYRSLISEVVTCFFLFEKGLHGTMTEEAKIHLETVEWANKFKAKEAEYGKVVVEYGYRITDLLNKTVQVTQQLYCCDVVELAAKELNKVLDSKSQVLASSILNKHWDKPYFSQTRNISLKGMSGQLLEDGCLAASVTLIEAIRYLTTHKHNPTLIELYNETKHIRAQARIVRKHQRTEADRGFFITTLPTRVRLEIIEDYYDAISKNVVEEYISYGGEKKILQVQSSLEKALRWASGTSTIVLSTGQEIVFRRKLMYVSADATKWSPGDNSAKFRLFTAILHNGLRDDLLKNCVIDALKNVYETEFFMSRRLKGYIDNMDDLQANVKEFKSFFDYSEGKSGLVRGNWLQGNLNKCSSLFGVAVSFLFKAVWTALYPELECFIDVAHHSDDALFVYGYLEPVGDGSNWFLYVTQKIQSGELHWHAVNQDMWKAMFNLHEHILLMGSIQISPKKTTVSPTNAEFLSTFFEGCAVSMPFTKILLGALSDLPGLGFFDDLAAAQSRCVKALDMGASPQVAQLAIGIVNNKIERLYGTAPGMINSPLKYLEVPEEDIPIALGGLGSNSIMELATAGIGMSDKCSLKKALTNYIYKNRGLVSYHLGLFKFLMELSEETFQHERLGEFCFTGKVQWKIFTPKTEFEFHDLYSKNLLEKWTDEHPAYDYVIPTGRDNLLAYLVRKLNDPSIMTAMTLQSPIQLRFRMQAKQHMKVCKYKGEWVTFRDILAAADIYAKNYQPSQRDLDLFQTLTNCTFSKEFAWRDFLNTVECEVIQSRRIHRPKVARTFTVKERDQSIQNPVSLVIAYRFANKQEEIRDVLQYSKYPDSLPSDLATLYEGVKRELGLDLSERSVMKRVAPMLYKTGRSRVVIVQGNVEGTAEGICSYWLKSLSFTKAIKVHPHREVLKAVSIFSLKEQSGDRVDLAALRICIEMWRWTKYNDLDVSEWLHYLWFEDRTLFDWVQKFQRGNIPLVDPEIQCAGLMIANVTGNTSILQIQANRRAYSGKQYDAYCYQTYNEDTKLYEGDLRVTFNFGVDCARLEIFWDKKEYLLETSVTSRHVLKLLMEEVTKELLNCGMRFKTEQAHTSTGMVLFKTDAGFEWGKPNIQCVIFRNCMLRTNLRSRQASKHDFKINIVENGFKAIAQYDFESPRFLLAHAYHTLRDVRYQAVDAVGPVYFKQLYLNPIIAAGLLENFMKGIPASIPPSAYSLIMNRAKISVDLFMFNKLLALINPNNVLNLEGLEATEEGYSTVTSLSSRDWAQEMEIMESDIEDDEYTVDLNDLDFDCIDTESDIEHFLQDESSYTSDLVVMTEPKEVKKMRGLVKVVEPVKLLKSWVTKGHAIEKVYNPIGIILMARYLSKHYNFGGQMVSTMDPYDLTELESIVRGWGELVFDQFDLYDSSAKDYVIEKNLLPEDVIPDSLFSFSHTKVLLNRLFLTDRSSSFY
ncbi:RNA-dependent RNA polymerase [Laibin virus]|uniref:RNA-directed RNA polymerase L n=1 Tax=Laibin virus TaxID=1633187 RepID=A0A0D5W380_9VIRU|nr:RNA-dependent RNA polymerase [Laibin virus]AJZ68872.1 RNA-dependent RNA polymerase [Laibin virus]